MAPSISLCLITKNARKTIAQAIYSAKRYVSEVIVVDSSTDETPEIVKKLGGTVIPCTPNTHPGIFTIDDESTGAPPPYTNQLFLCNYSVPRQASFDAASSDYLLWLDADDVLEGAGCLPGAVQKMEAEGAAEGQAPYNYWFDAQGRPTCVLQRGRLFRRSARPAWSGWGHETCHAAGGQIALEGISVRHNHVDRGARMAWRNYKILRKQLADEESRGPASPRTLYYLSRESPSPGERASYCERYLALPWQRGDQVATEEHYLAFLARGAACGGGVGALRNYAAATVTAPHLPDAWVALARLAREEGRFGECVKTLEHAFSLGNPPNLLMFDPRERLYFARMMHMLTLSENLGRVEDALKSCEIALRDYPGDKDLVGNRSIYREWLANRPGKPPAAPSDPPPAAGHPACLSELAASLGASLAELGVRKEVILGAHEDPGKAYPVDVVIFNTEQLSSAWFTPAYVSLLQKSKEVWDFDPHNVAKLKELYGVNAKLCRIGYHKCLETIPKGAEKDIDVLFVGTLNERRQRILDRVSQHCRVEVRTGVQGAERDALYARAKVVLNAHYYEPAVFEAVRCSYLLANGVCVVSEGPEAEGLGEAVVWAGYDQLAEACWNVLERGDWAEQGRKGQEIFRRLGQVDFLRGALYGPRPEGLVPSYGRVVVVCPTATGGGPEALHQLAHAINRLGGDAYMAYCSSADPVRLSGADFECSADSGSTERAYSEYCPRVFKKISLGGSLVVFPEVMSDLALNFRGPRAIWWLSVDTGVVFNPKLRDEGYRRDMFSRAGLANFCQSEYAHEFVASNGGAARRLFDYVDRGFRPDPRAPERDTIAYNPARNLEAANKFWGSFKFPGQLAPISRMTRGAVRETLQKTSVYVDFGSHPGKDRIPREAAACGAVVLLRRAGAARHYGDHPLDPYYLFSDGDAESGELAHRVLTILENPQHHWATQARYRERVSREFSEFEGQVKDIFFNSDKAAVTQPDGPLDIVIYTGPTWDPWTPDDINRKGLGGAETSCVHVAAGLRALGHRVRVYSDCGSAGGGYGGVEYASYEKFPPNVECDVLVSSREPRVPCDLQRVKLKYLWMHDSNVGPVPKEVMTQFDGYLLVSGWAKEAFLQNYEVDEKKIVLTRGGIDTARFAYLPEKKGPNCVYASCPSRGLERLLRLWPRVLERVPGAQLDCYYGFELWENLAKRCPETREGLERTRALLARSDPGSVHYHGMVPQGELARAFLAARVWAHPASTAETYCITAVEAQAAGCVPVTTRFSALAETVHHGVLIDPPDDPQEYADRFVGETARLLTDDDYHRSLAAPGREWALSSCGWGGVAEQWGRVFRERFSKD